VCMGRFGSFLAKFAAFLDAGVTEHFAALVEFGVESLQGAASEIPVRFHAMTRGVGESGVGVDLKLDAFF